MLVRHSTILDTSAERAWEAVMRPRLLDHVAAPLLTFQPIDPPSLLTVWTDGRYRARLRLFGVISIGTQSIGIAILARGPDRYVVRDDGRGDLAGRWDHHIAIKPIDARCCRYTDEVEVRAGLLTPFVWAFAQAFYRHRQRRWRALARADVTPLVTKEAAA